VTIDAVIFDFGGVILNLDYPATEKALLTLVGKKDAHYSKAHQGRIFDDLEIGAVDAKGFHEGMNELAGRPLDPQEVDKAFCAMLLDVRPERFDFIRNVGRHRRIFLFSNTNEIHKAVFDKTLERHLGPGGFDALFEAAYYSHLMGLRKPHPESYRHILDKQGLVAERTLFIDDNKDNIAGAASVGLQTVHLTSELIDDPRLQFLLKA
jgi:putative hydrolase of the HAD superfamily